MGLGFGEAFLKEKADHHSTLFLVFYSVCYFFKLAVNLVPVQANEILVFTPT